MHVSALPDGMNSDSRRTESSYQIKAELRKKQPGLRGGTENVLRLDPVTQWTIKIELKKFSSKI